MTKKYWLCYVSSARACGPVQVIPNPTPGYGVQDDSTWIAAAPNIDASDNVSEAQTSVVGEVAQCGKFFSKEDSSCYLITDNLEQALAFIDGARTARKVLAKMMLSYDCGPAEFLAASERPLSTQDDDDREIEGDDDES